MAHEILSVKLCELDTAVARLHSRIQLSEAAPPGQLRQEIELLQQECAASAMAMGQNLACSRAPLARALAQTYGEMEQSLGNARDRLHRQTAAETGTDAAESKLLLAEYALDFAIQAANRALLLSMQAIDAQRTQQQNEGSTV